MAWLSSHDAGTERKAKPFSGQNQKRVEMQVLQSWQRIASACTEGNKRPETMAKNSEVERHFGQASVLESKPQQTTSVSLSSSYGNYSSVTGSGEALWAGHHGLFLEGTGSSPCWASAAALQFGTGSRPQDCPVLMAVEIVLWPIRCRGSWWSRFTVSTMLLQFVQATNETFKLVSGLCCQHLHFSKNSDGSI